MYKTDKVFKIDDRFYHYLRTWDDVIIARIYLDKLETIRVFRADTDDIDLPTYHTSVDFDEALKNDIFHILEDRLEKDIYLDVKDNYLNNDYTSNVNL